MCTLQFRTRNILPFILGLVTLASVLVLLVWDAFPSLFSANAHNLLAAFPLVMIAFAYLAHQRAQRVLRMELLKAVILAVAFLFWAANQLWPDLPQATLFNDIAIALFILDVFLVIIGWPARSPREAFAETSPDAPQE
jgi:hypothetical protein